MSDSVDDVYNKYFGSQSGAEVEAKIPCPRCASENVDRRAGYRGEYRCTECGYFWQVGGRDAT